MFMFMFERMFERKAREFKCPHKFHVFTSITHLHHTYTLEHQTYTLEHRYTSDAILRKLQLRFGPSCKIEKPGRRLVSEGVFTQKDSFFRSKRFMVLLFNDCIMFYLDGESRIDETILMVDIVEVRSVLRENISLSNSLNSYITLEHRYDR